MMSKISAYCGGQSERLILRFKQALFAHFGSTVINVRKLAAKSFVAFTERQNTIAEVTYLSTMLTSKAYGSTNFQHGVLYCIREFLKRQDDCRLEVIAILKELKTNCSFNQDLLVTILISDSENSSSTNSEVETKNELLLDLDLQKEFRMQKDIPSLVAAFQHAFISNEGDIMSDTKLNRTLEFLANNEVAQSKEFNMLLLTSSYSTNSEEVQWVASSTIFELLPVRALGFCTFLKVTFIVFQRYLIF